MPKFNPDNINIHELAVEEPENQAELPFDPDKDITEDEWKKFINEADKYFLPENLQYLSSGISHLANMKVLSSISKHKMPQFDGEKLIEYFDNFQHSDVLFANRGGCKVVSGAAILGLGKLRSKTESETRGVVDSWSSVSRPENFADNYAMAKIAGLDLPELTEEQKKKLLAHLEILCKNEIVGKFYDLVAYAADLKIMGINFSLPEENWNNIVNIFNEAKGFDGRSNNMLSIAAKLAFEMSIITSDGIRIPEGGGLEIIRRKKEDLKTETPNLPEAKQF